MSIGRAAVAVMLGLTALAPAGLAQTDFHSGPQPGQRLPSPVQMLAVVGPFAGRFHCPVCENGLDPGILVFLREPPAADSPAAKLLAGVGELIAQRRDLSPAAAAVVLNDGGYRDRLQAKVDESVKAADAPLAQAIAFKNAMTAQLTALAKDLKLQLVEIGLTGPAGPPGYDLNKDADVTLIAYHKDTVVLSRAYRKGELTAEEVSQVLADLRDALARIAAAEAQRRGP